MCSRIRISAATPPSALFVCVAALAEKDIPQCLAASDVGWQDNGSGLGAFCASAAQPTVHQPYP